MFSELIAITSLILTLIFGGYALKLARNMYKRPPEWLEGTLESGITTLLEPNEEGHNIIDLVADRFGKGFRMSLLAQKSGEARHEKMIENRVFEAAKTQIPEVGLGLAALEKFGLGDLATPENLPSLIRVAQKYGLLDFLTPNPGSRRNESKPRGFKTW